MAFNKTKKTKSPLKDKPLRNPGQSLDEELQRIIYEDALILALVTILFIVTAALEWWRFYNPVPPNPVVATFFAAGITIYCVIRLVFVIKKARRLKLGQYGEMAVGQYLELLREKGCRVFHDIVGKGFNIDHVVISNRGIYVIETKTYSKPARGEAVIYYDGENLQKNGYKLDSNPVTQVKAAANEIRTILEESTGRKFFVKPVVVFPGWFIKDDGANRKSEVWVLEPKALPSFIDNQLDALSLDDLRLAVYHLSRYIRSI